MITVNAPLSNLEGWLRFPAIGEFLVPGAVEGVPDGGTFVVQGLSRLGDVDSVVCRALVRKASSDAAYTYCELIEELPL